MIYLILSILFSTSIFVVFKLFDLYKINTLQAIITNYLVAFIIGFLSSNIKLGIIEIYEKPWFLNALLLAIFFIIVFYIMALTSQKNGLSVASIASKMSVVLPITFGIVIYKENLGFYKFIGIILALISVYLSSIKQNIPNQKPYFLYPFLLFIGSGLIDTYIKYVEKNYVDNNEIYIFSSTIFFFSFFLGVIFFLFINKKINSKLKNIIGGFFLGIVNYYSIIFLLQAFKTKEIESSSLYTINNVSIVLLTTILGFIFFNEKLSIKNKIGILVALISVFLVLLN